MMLLVPADVVNPRRVDEHFAAEAEVARAGGHRVALVDHDALAAGRDVARAVARVPAGEVAVYRGWMLSSQRYGAFVGALAGRGTRVLTGAEEYRMAHELPGWYSQLVDFTPESVWTTGTDRTGFDAARQRLGEGPAVLRDYTKSMKHYWDEAAYIPDLADTDAAWAVARRFVELRADDLAGGFVLRRFEEFVGAEVRTWWIDGSCRLVTAHPDTPDRVPPAVDMAELVPVVSALGLPFVTVDLARHRDGRWRVVELGDGQVSDRPSSTQPEALIDQLLAG